MQDRDPNTEFVSIIRFPVAAWLLYLFGFVYLAVTERPSEPSRYEFGPMLALLSLEASFLFGAISLAYLFRARRLPTVRRRRVALGLILSYWILLVVMALKTLIQRAS